MAGSVAGLLQSLSLESHASVFQKMGVNNVEDLELLEDGDYKGEGIDLVAIRKIRKALGKTDDSLMKEDPQNARTKVEHLRMQLDIAEKAVVQLQHKDEDNQRTIESLNEQVALHKRRLEEVSIRMDRMKQAHSKDSVLEGEKLHKALLELEDANIQVAEMRAELRSKDMELQSMKAMNRTLESSLEEAHNSMLFRNANSQSQQDPISGSAVDLVRALRVAPPYCSAVDHMIHALGHAERKDPMVLLPLLRGLLSEVIQREDYRCMSKKAESHFDRFGAKVRGLQKASRGNTMPEPDVRPGLRRWRRALRSIFNEDAAVAMIDTMLTKYRSEEFAEACRSLNESWPEGARYSQQKTDVHKLCLRMGLAPIIMQYGFTDDLRGWQDATAAINALSETSADVRERDNEVSRILMGHFTRFSSEPIEEFSASGEAALSRARVINVLKQHGYGADEDSDFDDLDDTVEKKEVDFNDLDNGGKPTTPDARPASAKAKARAQRIPRTFQGRAQQKVAALREAFPE